MVKTSKTETPITWKRDWYNYSKAEMILQLESENWVKLPKILGIILSHGKDSHYTIHIPTLKTPIPLFESPLHYLPTVT